MPGGAPNLLTPRRPGAALLRDRTAQDGTGLAQKKVRDMPVEARKVLG